MANTFSQLYVHYVFAVKGRDSLILETWRHSLYKYMNGIIEQHGHKPFTINGISDHVHVLVSMNPNQAPSDLMYEVKRSTSIWINENRFVPGKFSWQEGFGAFSYGKSQIPSIARYIENQQQHHKKRTFYEEYLAFLKIFEIEYDERYVFKPIQ